MELRHVAASIVALGAAFGLAAPALAAPAAAPAAPVGAVAPIDRILAVVDGTPIWWSEWGEQVKLIPGGVQGDARTQAEAAALEDLITAALVQRAARAQHLEVADAEIDAALVEVAKQNGLDAAQLAAEVAKVGLTMPAYREALRQQILDLRTFGAWAAAHGAPPAPSEEARATAHAAWLVDLRRGARIERR